MSNVRIEVDELYPFYYISSDVAYGREVEFSDEEVLFIRDAMNNFWKAQELMGRGNKLEYVL
jgi:hypothetical protein